MLPANSEEEEDDEHNERDRQEKRDFNIVHRLRIVCERSLRMSSWTEAGSCALIDGISARIPSTTATVLVPGCFCTVRTIAPGVAEPARHAIVLHTVRSLWQAPRADGRSISIRDN
jgi:hypothetical protein